MKKLMMILVTATILFSLQEAPAVEKNMAEFMPSPQEEIMSQDKRMAFRHWCQNRLQLLSRAYNEAMLHYQHNNSMEALKYLVSGLVDAKADMNPYYTGALTVRAITRGLEMYEGIKGATTMTTGQVKTLVHFLFKQYQFIRDVSEKLDSLYYIPNRNSWFSYESNEDVERNFITFTRQQVKMVMSTMTSVGPDHVVYPKGEPEGFLKALEMTSFYMVMDLRESLYQYQYSCAIMSFSELAGRLSQSAFHNVFYAVNQSYMMAQEALGSMTQCGSSRQQTPMMNPTFISDRQDIWYENTTDTETLKSWSFTLNQDHPFKTIEFRKQARIKMLYIVAEGNNRNGGAFDIFINGQFKRNVEVPGGDPIYLTSLDDVTSSIQLRWTRGSVSVKRIEATFQQSSTNW